MKNKFANYLVDINQTNKLGGQVENIFKEFSKELITSFHPTEILSFVEFQKTDKMDINVPKNISLEGLFDNLKLYPLKMSNLCPDNIGGAFNPLTKKVYINKYADKSVQLHSLFHELSHYILKHDVDEHTQTCELEAEFSSYIVERMIGITNNHSKFYILRVFNKDVVEIENTVNISEEYIKRTSKILLKSLDCYI